MGPLQYIASLSVGAVGSGTPATHRHSARRQWAVQLLRYTASLPGGSGQCHSCNALPHCLGAVSRGTAAIDCLTAWGQWAAGCGVVWYGVVWCGVVWCGVVWYGVVWCGAVRCGVVWCGVVWCSPVSCGVAVFQYRVYTVALLEVTHQAILTPVTTLALPPSTTHSHTRCSS